MCLFAWTAYFVFGKQARAHLDAVEFVTAMSVVAFAAIAVVAVGSDHDLAVPDGGTWAVILALGLGTGGIGHFLINWAHGHAPLVLTSLLTLLIPVLAMAGAFTRAAAQGTRPARSVVFALWNGEEKGSLGAEYYVSHPVPARRIVANVNLDMVGRDEDIPDPDDPRYRGFAKTRASDNTNVVHLLGYSYAPDLAHAADAANESIHLIVKQDYDRDSQNLVRRSDNWPFLEHGIPAVFLTTGLHPDYHTPDDDTARIDFPKLERITELASRLVWMAADGEAPRFHAQ